MCKAVYGQPAQIRLDTVGTGAVYIVQMRVLLRVSHNDVIWHNNKRHGTWCEIGRMLVAGDLGEAWKAWQEVEK